MKKDDKRNDAKALENVTTKQVRNNSTSFKVRVNKVCKIYKITESGFVM